MTLAIGFFDTDAFIPLGKYKALAEEADKKNKAKRDKKAQKTTEKSNEASNRGSHEIVWRDVEETTETQEAENTEIHG